MSDITNLATTTTTLTADENKIPNASNLVKKQTITQKHEIERKVTTDHDHDRYITI